MNKPQDGVYLMYVQDGIMYPVALNKEQHHLLQSLAAVFNPLRLVKEGAQEAGGIEELRKRGVH